MLINGIIFRVFLGPDKHLQVCKCPVAVWSVISKVHLSSHHGSYMLWQQMSPKWNQIQPDKVWGKAIRDKFAFCAVGDTGQKGTFDSVLNLKYHISRPIRCIATFSLEILEKNNDECILILVIYWKKTGLLHTKISNHNIIYSSQKLRKSSSLPLKSSSGCFHSMCHFLRIKCHLHCHLVHC